MIKLFCFQYGGLKMTVKEQNKKRQHTEEGNGNLPARLEAFGARTSIQALHGADRRDMQPVRG
jgi:hypothetical protein